MHPANQRPSPEALVRRVLTVVRAAVGAGEAVPSLASLAAVAGVSGRTLQRHFLDVLGKTPRDAIGACRLQRAILLVQTTSLPLSDVAAAVGFGSQSRMNELFRRVLGRRPGEFRAAGDKPVWRSEKTGGEPHIVKSACVSRRRKTAGGRRE